MFPVFLFIFTILFWWLIAVSYLLASLSLWQLKEYRLDRIWAHFQTLEGRKDFLNFFTVGKITLFLAFVFLSPRQPLFKFLYPLLFLAWLLFYLFDIILVLRKLARRRFSKPDFTPKALLIIGLTLFFLLGLFFSASFLDSYLLATVYLPLLVGLTIGLVSLPTRSAKKRILAQARQKISQSPHLRVIGITGSFGKTSTKEFLATILAAKYRVLATLEHQNTPLGIAQQILKILSPRHQIYVVEMGAYKIGEIKQICDLVKPEIGLLTGLGQQHLSLFGSFENLLQAKFELIASLPSRGAAFFNGDNQPCLDLAKKTGVKKIIFSTQNKKSDFFAQKIKALPRRVEFLVANQKIEAPLLGRQNVINLLGAIAVARHLGLNWEEIQKGIAKISSSPGTMHPVFGPQGSFLVDDSYNANPEGVLAALEYLQIHPQKKFLILQPLIELGEKSLSEHERIFKKAVQVCDRICLTNKNFYQKSTQNLPAADQAKIVLAPSPAQLAQELIPQLRKKDVLLFEGRESRKYLKAFQNV